MATRKSSSNSSRKSRSNPPAPPATGARGNEEPELPQVRRCATDRVHLRLLLEQPEYAARRAAVENQAFRARMAFRTGRGMAEGRTGCTRIPVVVHVVSRTATENISQAQIDSQIDVLNQDFRKKNSDVSSVPAVFQSLAADARIEFALATTDPSGNPTNGVTRRTTTVNGFTDDDAVKRNSTGGTDAWPADRYLNLWVCRLAGGLLGYAQFPGGPAATDGVVITYTAFGNTGAAAAPFEKGRTAVHEIGHWLNLRHIWGDDDTACSGSDFVDDTPNQAGANTGKPTFPRVSCGNGPNGDMFMNYMDYVDDAAMFMFSAGQIVRMQAALDGSRASMGTSISCGPKLKFADEPITLKFRDDGITLKFRDDPITLKFRDDPATLKFRDDPATLKFRDDPGSLKFRDDGTGTVKGSDDVKMPGLDKPPGDTLTPPDVTLPPNMPFRGQQQQAPFILATPHHSNAWQQSYPDAAEAAVSQYEQQLAEYEQMLQSYADAESAGHVSEQDQQAMNELYAEYTRLADEYRQLTGDRR
jgi:hypothetical protein